MTTESAGIVDPHTETADVVIVGAGIAGAALACALRDSGLQTLILEAAPRRDLPSLDHSVSGFLMPE